MGKSTKNGYFHSYVSLPEGKSTSKPEAKPASKSKSDLI